LAELEMLYGYDGGNQFGQNTFGIILPWILYSLVGLAKIWPHGSST
jgi:hypothetical protein